MTQSTPANNTTSTDNTSAVSIAIPGADAPWWRRAVVYQIYPRSFADANGDGMGDVQGMISHLDHLDELGVDAIWISPWYPSPMKDGGYDVADYRNIDPRFGTLDDARELIAKAHERDIRVIVDLVPNHTSTEHVWFQEALAAAPGSPERDRYIFLDGKGPNGDEPPTNWTAVFGGSTWERVPDGQWYLHMFDPSQPDLNWRNEEVQHEFDEIFRFWIEMGVDGFRIDVAHGLVKDWSFPDLPKATALLSTDHIPNHPFWDRDGVHEIIRRWRAVLDAEQARTGRDLMMVAEAWVTPESLPKYLRPDEYHQSFNFDFLEQVWDRDGFRQKITAAVTAARKVGSAPTWTLSNHDVMRHPTRYGLPNDVTWRLWYLDGPFDVLDQDRGNRRALAATLTLLALPGSMYLYEGEELLLPDVWDLPAEVLDDPAWENSGHTVKGRDGCRVPLPWTPDGPSFGFGSVPGWLPQPALFGPLSAATQAPIPQSPLNLYRRALALRAELFESDEDFEWVDIDGDALAFRRGSGVLTVLNMGDEPITLPAGEEIIRSRGVTGPAGTNSPSVLLGESAVWLRPA